MMNCLKPTPFYYNLQWRATVWCHWRRQRWETIPEKHCNCFFE